MSATPSRLTGWNLARSVSLGASMKALLLPLLRARPILAFLRWLSRAIDGVLRGDFESRFVRQDSSGRIEGLIETAERALAVATPLEKQRFHAWAEDRALADEHTLAYALEVFE